MDKLYIVIPAYNEEENIESVVNDWYPVVEKIGNDSRLVIMDDGSKDSTYAKMQELVKSRPMFTPVTKENEGHGAT
ncbi:MAG: glycosyltransferase, partial [Lachnospiraceae bacterium]|nr:glycosyltransferase [Lachnospiraceae bacterium]